nr:energy-coupling factor ABC transporter permease [Enterovibrio nigricans]
MHIVDGVLSPEILIAGGVVSTLFVAIGLKQLTPEKHHKRHYFVPCFSLLH